MIHNNPALPSATTEQKQNVSAPSATIPWKPSELEAAVLKLHFQNNKYPTTDEKENLAQLLRDKFNSKVERDQISRWFKYEREKAAKKAAPESNGHTYKKFSAQELDYLNESFNEDNYPRLETMVSMANHLNVSLSKIENWYKHSRRTLAKRGQLMLKTKKYFKSEELNYLNEMFEKYSCPTKKQIREIAENLNCNEIQIKNWYSNRKKKFRTDLKKNSLDIVDDKIQETKQNLITQHNLRLAETSNFNNIPSSFVSSNIIQPSSNAPFLSLPQPVLVLNNGLANNVSHNQLLLKNIPPPNINHTINHTEAIRQPELPQLQQTQLQIQALPNTKYLGPIGVISPSFCPPVQNVTPSLQPIIIRTTSPHLSSPALISPQLSSHHVKHDFSYTFGYQPTFPNNSTFLSNNFSLVSTPSSISSHTSSTQHTFIPSNFAPIQAPNNQFVFPQMLVNDRAIVEDSPVKKRLIIPCNEGNFGQNFELGQRFNVVPH